MLHPSMGRTLREPVELSSKAKDERGVEFGSCGQGKSDLTLGAAQLGP